MFYIGICDDVSEERKKIYDLCESFFMQKAYEHKYIMFSCGEDVISYCKNNDKSRIDILFLDIEMNGISGIELKDILMKENKIWRIAFVSSHMESAFDAYSVKTIGFISKPPCSEKITKMLTIVLDELQEDITIKINGYKDEIFEIKLEDIIYLKGSGCYTEIYTYSLKDKLEKYILSTKKLGETEKILECHSIIRVHKSYMVNLQNVIEINNTVSLRGYTERVPVGRKYKENIKQKYLEYGRNKMNRRL